MRNLFILSSVILVCGLQSAHAQSSGCGLGPETPLSNMNGSGENADLREAQGGGGPSLGFSTCDRDSDRRFGPQFNKDNAVDNLGDPDPKSDPVWGIVKAEPEQKLALPDTEAETCIEPKTLTPSAKQDAIAQGKTLCPTL